MLYAIADAALALSPSGEVCVCLGESLTFTCQVSGPSWLEWMIQFEGSLSEPDVIQSYFHY